MQNNLSHPKIVDLAKFLPLLKELKKHQKTLVFTNGCFDILHPGHVDLLARCKTFGDILILGLNSDASVVRQNKKPPRPINPYAQRAFVLAHLAATDFIVDFNEDTPLKLIEQIKPQVLIKGGDWELSKIVGREIVEENGGKVLTIPLLENFSTTALINKIKKL